VTEITPESDPVQLDIGTGDPDEAQEPPDESSKPLPLPKPQSAPPAAKPAEPAPAEPKTVEPEPVAPDPKPITEPEDAETPEKLETPDQPAAADKPEAPDEPTQPKEPKAPVEKEAPEPAKEPSETEAPEAPSTSRSEELLQEGSQKAEALANTLTEKAKQVAADAKPLIGDGIDLAIATALRTKFKLEDRIDSDAIEVSVADQIVTLSGTVDSAASKKLAIEIAVFAKGVNGVEETLSIAEQ
jgi:hypothetical protein